MPFILNMTENVIIWGAFDSEIDAAKIYDREAKIHHGEFANLNFKS